VVDTSVAGDLVVGGTGFRIAGSTIGGNLVVSNVRRATDPLSSGTNVVCNTTVNGQLVVHNGAGAAPLNLGQCGANTVKGNTR
jgi:hypothetical protein